jgi:hypothetical protein
MRTRLNDISDQVAQLRTLLLTPRPPDEAGGAVPHPANGSANRNGLNGHGRADHPSLAGLRTQRCGTAHRPPQRAPSPTDRSIRRHRVEERLDMA